MTYALTVTTPLPPDQAEARVRETLQAAGFGIVAADPEAMLAMSDAELTDLACDARERIQRALDAVMA